MSVEQDLQDFILTKYKSVNQFADKAGVAYTTVKGGLSRGIMGMSVQNIIKICNTLNIDINKLADGKIETAKKSISLDIDEFNLINQFRAVDSFGKQLIIDIAKHEYNRCQTAQAQEQKQDNVINLPYYYGGVSAGFGNPTVDEYKVLRQVPRTALTEKADFIVQVSGDSMLPTFSDGDLLLIKSQQSVEVGEVGIFVVEGSEMYVKRFGGDRLIPDNKKYPDIPISEDTVCQGKVIGKL